MSGPSIYPALAIKPPDVINALQEYANVGKTDAETGLTKAQTVTEGQRPAYVQAQTGLAGAQTAKAQIENELAKIGLGVSQYYLDAARGGANAGNEPLPGMASEGSSYSAQPDVDPARYAKAAPPPTPAQQAVVDAAADKYGVPKEVAYWVGTHESNWNRDAVGSQTSSGRARGAWQFMDATAKDYNLADPTDFASSTDAAMHYLADLHAKTGDWGSAIQHYGTFSTGQGAGRDAAVRQGWQSYASEHGLGQAPAPYKVAGAVQPPPSGGQPAPVPGAAPPAAGGGGGPNALAQGNPMGTSGNGRMMPGLGVAVPLGTALSIASATDKIGAITKALTERRATLAQLAGSATDPAAWNNNVAQAWRVGYLTNGEFQQYYNHFELRDQVVRSLSTPEAQTGFQEKLIDKGLRAGSGGTLTLEPGLKAGEPPIEMNVPVLDQNGRPMFDSKGFQITRKQQIPAEEYYRLFGHGAGGAPGAPAAPGGGGGTAAAPPPAAAPAVTAPNGGTISGPGAATAGPGAPVPSESGTVTAPAPPAMAAPAGVGAGPINETPGTKQAIELDTAQRKADIAVAQKNQEQQIEIANKGAAEVADAYGKEAGQMAKNSILASSSLEKLDILDAAAKDVQTGPTAAIRTAAVNRIVDTLGLIGIKVPDALARQAAAAGAIDKLGGFLAAAQVRQMGDRAASVFEAVKGINPNLGSGEPAFRAVLESLREDAIRDQDVERFRRQWMGSPAEGGLGHKDIGGMMEEFNKQHSPLSYASRVIQPPLPPKDQLQDNVIYRAKNGQRFLWLNGTMVERP